MSRWRYFSKKDQAQRIVWRVDANIDDSEPIPVLYCIRLDKLRQGDKRALAVRGTGVRTDGYSNTVVYGISVKLIVDALNTGNTVELPTELMGILNDVKRSEL